MDSPLLHHWVRRANKCRTNEGQGDCIDKDRCAGISTPDVCPNDSAGIQCCLLHECSVPQGEGLCASKERDGCPDGELVPGTGPPWPCMGGNDIQCCVKSTNIKTATQSSSVPTTTSGSATANSSSSSSRSTRTSIPSNTAGADADAASSSATAQAEADSDSGLSGGQIGGISAGVVVAALLIIASLVWLFLRRRRRAQKSQSHQGQPPGVAEIAAEPKEKTDAELVGTPVSPGAGTAPQDMKHWYMAPGSEASPTELDDPQSPLHHIHEAAHSPVELPAHEGGEPGISKYR